MKNDELTIVTYGNRLTDTSFRDFQMLWSQNKVEPIFDNQRYGQAFCNYFGITDTELFYATDGVKIRAMIENYLQDYQING